MSKPGWRPLDGRVVKEIEILNGASLVQVVAGLVTYTLARQAQDGGKNPRIPDEAALLLFHRAAMQFLLPRPGRYRSESARRVRSGIVVMRGVPPRKLKSAMREFFRGLASIWQAGDALDVAGYALWHITRIHPFANGNGRAAAAFAYACLCLKLGALLPGPDTVLDRLLAKPSELRGVLRRAGKGLAGSSREPNHRVVKKYLDGLLLRQMRSVEASKDATAV